MTKVIDISHVRGDTFSRTLSLTASGISVSSFPEVWFTVRSALPAAEEIDDTLALSSGTLTGGEISESGVREWEIVIDNPNWPVGRLNYDVQVRSGSGQVFTITKGMLRVFADITRSS